MSVRAIRGQTKGSNGDYIRQLAFYTLLLSNDSKYKDKVVNTSLMFMVPHTNGQCPIVSVPVGTGDVEELQRNINDLIKSVWGGLLENARCDDEKCLWCAVRKIHVNKYE